MVDADVLCLLPLPFTPHLLSPFATPAYSRFSPSTPHDAAKLQHFSLDSKFLPLARTRFCVNEC